ncbi:MAG: AEC family transporter, partial [Marinosulfonomonas sp.]|nr:AEC family transporter [Marinosulfonomonas sp.]
TITWTLGGALDLPQGAFRSAVLTSAMAPGINAYIFANMYGVARRVAASAVLLGTAATIFTAWIWLGLLG